MWSVGALSHFSVVVVGFELFFLKEPRLGNVWPTRMRINHAYPCTTGRKTNSVLRISEWETVSRSNFRNLSFLKKTIFIFNLIQNHQSDWNKQRGVGIHSKALGVTMNDDQQYNFCFSAHLIVHSLLWSSCFGIGSTHIERNGVDFGARS